ncbi:hypothetical protein [Novipirellula artificiosorum]|uniref:Peptidase C39-like domain-containing protein n=1 Tax=Novipirellula artificiosorum TaxID=2528016 RepID=A0A5C6D786_9BACT|nr:hypothetical protein [Novipirellula artificiosorum]TWU31935.1 hypothetical protein Poly41_58230 [Novipirellula artificiosorum]
MTIHYRDDSDHVTHQVWAQQQASSCAIASIWMARNQALQMTVNEAEWALAWRTYHQVVAGLVAVPEAPAPMSLSPGAHQNNQETFGNMFANFGTFMGQVAQAIRNDGLTVTHLTNFTRGNTVDGARLSDTAPAIVLLGWYEGSTRNGGHFIVASRRATSGKIVYLDPAGGRLRELGVGPVYLGNGRFEQIIYITA